MSSTNLMKVFVYGTLKKGEPNHHWLTTTASKGFSKFLCNAVTTRKFPLVVATRYNIPFLLNRPGTGNFIKGEIYEIDEKMLKNLDVLEDYPRFYDREIQDVSGLCGEVPCWVYFLKNYPDEILKLPFLSEYKNTEEKPYLEGPERVGDVPAMDDLCYNIPS